VCNPKNYAAWLAKIELERREKAHRRAAVEAEALQLERDAEEDRHRINKKLQESSTASSAEMHLYSSGDKFSGSFNSSGERDGTGVMIFLDGGEYVGEWKNDLEHGFGTRTWIDGISFSGEWREGKMNGKGIYKMADGTILEGTFLDDEFVE